MKQKSWPLLLTLIGLIGLAGCSPGSKSSSNTSSSSNPLCQQFPSSYGCQVGTTGLDCTNSPMTIGCPQYCVANPTAVACGGNVVPPGQTYTTIPSDNSWTALYPNGVPPESCATPTGTGYDLRKGTVTIAGGTWYTPANAWTSVGDSQYSSISYTHNNSSFLVDPLKAKLFFDTDAKLRVRMKVRPQPKPPVGKTWCYNRVTGMSADTYGYTVLKFNVSLRGLNPDGTLKPTLQNTQSVTVPVNSCSTTLDFSGLNQSNPDGVVLVVHDVQSDQGCFYNKNCTSFVAVRSASCWQMDFEVSADGTKDI